MANWLLCACGHRVIDDRVCWCDRRCLTCAGEDCCAETWGAHVQPLTPSADVPACRDEDPAAWYDQAAAYPDPPEYAHPEDDDPLPPPNYVALEDW